MSARTLTLLASAVLAAFVFVAGSAPAEAKEKPQPAPQWAVDAAKTPTPTNINNAPAVVLFHEYLITVDGQNRAIERERQAVRILKPQGRGFAYCAVGYDIDEKLNYFHSWTFTPDGRHLQAMETDFIDHGAYESSVLQMTERVRSVKPPAVDPGAVVACETEEQLRPNMSEKTWHIQEPIPVVDQTLELALPSGGHFADAWHNFAPMKPTESGSNRLRWEIKDMPTLDLENIHATPDWEALAARVSIQWGDTAVKGIESQWHAIGLWQEQLEANRHDATPEIAAKAQELIAGAPDFYTRLSRITQYIQENIRYFVVERGIGGWQPHYAGDIYRNRYGDCKDKATLLIAMLQAVGIGARSLSVDHRRGFVDPDAPSRFSDHMIVAVELPEGENDPRLMARVKTPRGKTLLIFDPTDQETPVGLIRTELQAGWGYLANGPDSQILQMPVLPPESAGRNRKGSFTLTADGTLAGDIVETLTGDDASVERWHLRARDSKEIQESLEKSLGTDLPGLAFKGYEFRHAAELDKPLGLDMHFSATGYAQMAGPLLLFRPRILGSHVRFASDVMEGKPRSYAIEMGHPGRWRDSFDITLPQGYVVDELPDRVDVDVEFASYHSSVKAKSGQIHYEREYVVRQVEIQPGKAADFRKLENAILNDEKGTAVLKKQ